MLQDIRERPSCANCFGYTIVVTTFCLFLLRDSFQSAIRFFLNLVSLDYAWYLVDVATLLVILIFCINQLWIKKNLLGFLIFFSFLFSICISVFFTNDSFTSLFASVKMFAPIFVGYSLFNGSVLKQKFVQRFLLTIFLCSSFGLILNSSIDYPWNDFILQGFGNERSANKLWWSSGKVRYGGLAGESTVAAFSAIFCYILISTQRGFWFNLTSWILLFFAIKAADSKTALGILLLFVLIYLIRSTIQSDTARLNFSRLFAFLSFASLLIPPILIIFLNGYKIGEAIPFLSSLQDRIESTWQVPFQVVDSLFPAGIVTGCGIGCFTYPMDLTRFSAYAVPLDNYFLASYLMLGVPYLVILAMQAFAIHRNVDETKLILLGFLNIYGITVQMYGMSMALVLMGYALSETFNYYQKSSVF